MSALATEHNAVNLSQGFPDFEVSRELIDRVYHYMREGFNQYAPMPGVPELREAIAAKVESMYGRKYNVQEEITVMPGATPALYSAITAVIRPGDEVIVFDPAYDSYRPAVELCGGVTVAAPLTSSTFAPDWGLVRSMVNERTKLIVINTPHNPTGTVWSESDMRELIAIVRDTDILILSDEVYEHIIFDGLEHQSVIRFSELAERSFAVFSFGKTFHATGWKTGYCLAPRALTKELRKVYQFVNFTSNRPIQHAIADFLADSGNYRSLGEFYQERRDYFLNLIRGSRFRFTPAQGTYFQSLSYAEISDESDLEFSKRLVREHGVASVPISVFNGDLADDKLLRFCFAKSHETLERGAEILCKI